MGQRGFRVVVAFPALSLLIFWFLILNPDWVVLQRISEHDLIGIPA